MIPTADSSFIILFGSLLICEVRTGFQTEEEFERFILTEYEANQTVMCHNSNVANWDFNMDITNTTKESISALESSKLADATQHFYNNYFKDLSRLNLTKEWSKRHARYLSKVDDAALPRKEYERLTDVLNEMISLHSSATVCPYNRKVCDVRINGLSLDPDIEEIMAKSENLKELAYFWEQYRSQTGLRIKPLFEEYVALKNKAAKLNNYLDAGDLWRDEFEIQNISKVLDTLWIEVKPLYDELHYYVLHKLSEHYGDKINISDGLIPAHVTGDIHGHTWTNLMSKVIPYPKAGLINITSALVANSYTALKMFQLANEFYTSMGLEDMSMAFGEKGIIEKPKRPIVCHPTAWEFCSKTDFRISMCTKVTHSDFLLVHHELGHIQYYLQYRDQPVTLKDAPNHGFHEAIGDAIVLSVMSSTHLKKIGLLGRSYKITNKSTINFLMSAALSFVPMLPYALILDKWRWAVFSGDIKKSNWNDVWWDYSKTVQKIKPPVSRSSRDFDPGSKYHVAADVQFIPYFIATIVQFQIYRGLCITAGKYHPGVPFTTPFHECDFYSSVEAGEQLKSGLRLGASVHWTKVLQLISGDDKFSTKAILEYFQPLMDFLVRKNKRTREMLDK